MSFKLKKYYSKFSKKEEIGEIPNLQVFDQKSSWCQEILKKIVEKEKKSSNMSKFCNFLKKYNASKTDQKIRMTDLKN